MAAENNVHSNEELPDNELGIRVVSADEMEPANVIADVPDPGAGAQDGDAWPRDEQRWQEIFLGFVDDPRACVQAANKLVEDDVSVFGAFLRQGRESILTTASGEDGAEIEQMRQLVVTYRGISRQLAASAQVCQLILAGR